jgi:hypothetical protein
VSKFEACTLSLRERALRQSQIGAAGEGLKSLQKLSPSPGPLPEGEGESTSISIILTSSGPYDVVVLNDESFQMRFFIGSKVHKNLASIRIGNLICKILEELMRPALEIHRDI